MMQKAGYIWMLWLVVLLFLPGCHPEREPKKKVLVLHTYHNGANYWQTELLRGIKEGFRDQHVAVEAEHIFLDFEQLQSMERLIGTLDRIFQDHKGERRPDLIFITYEPVFYTLACMYMSLPDRYDKDIPIVYCGTHYRTNKLDKIANFIGVNSAPDYNTNLKLGFKLFPDIHRVRIFNLEQGMSNLISLYMEQVEPYLKKLVDTNYWKTPAWTVLRNAKKSTSVDHIPYIGIIPLWSGVYSRMVQNSDYPALLVHSVGLGEGFLGGYIASSYDESYHGATIAGRILKGENMKDIPVEDTPKRYIFDWKVMQKFGIREEQLPAGAEIIQRPFVVRYAPELYGGGGLVFLFLLIAFMSYRKQFMIKKRVQKELQASETNLRSILLSIREGIVSVDHEFRIFEINQQALDQMRLKGGPEDYLHLSVFSLMDIVDSSTGKNLTDVLSKGLWQRQFGSWEVYGATLRCKENGVVVPVYADVNSIVQEGQLYGAVITFRNIEAELKREEYLNLIAANRNILIWQYDSKSGTVIANQPLEKNMSEYRNGQYIYSLDKAFSMVHPEDFPNWLVMIKKLLKEGTRNEDVQVRIKNPDGGYNWWSSKVTALHNSTTDTLPIIVGVLLNIQWHKEVEKELVQGRLRAMQGDRLKSAFLANMSHEIRTPLNAVVGFANLLCEDRNSLSSEELVQYTGLIQKNSNLLLRLIDDIVDLSCIESNTVNFEYSDCNLSELIEEIVATQQMLIPSHLKLYQKVPDEAICLYIDKQRLNQVLTNLINNAVKFTEKGSITIGYVQEGEDDVLFFVEDTGKGISEEDCQKIFTRFFKKYDHIQGAGLGLSICRMIVGQFGGKISVTSRLGEGSRFEIRIPKK